MPKRLTFLEALLIIVPLTIAIRGSNNMLITTIPLVARYQLSFNNSEIGLISAVIALSTFISSGILNSRLSSPIRRKAFITSTAVYALILPLFYYSNPLLVWALSAIAGLSLGLMMPNVINAAGLLEDRKARERLLSIYTLALSVSLVVGPAVESLVLKFYPLRYVFLWFEPFALLAFVLSFFLEFPQEANGKKVEVKVFSNPGFKVAVLNILSYNVPFATITAFAGVYAKEAFGLSYSEVTAFFSAFFVTSLLARLYLSLRPAEKISGLITFSVSLTVIGLTLATLSGNPLLFLGALLVLGIPHGITYPLSVISISRTFKAEERNAANSQFFAIMMLIGVVTPLVDGVVAQALGIRPLFALLIPIVLAFLIMLKRHVKVVDLAVMESKKAQKEKQDKLA
ncbi:MAG: MFS transporter [Candidatus Aramenus sulfurataquae]|uniref:MFS transporter n=2 Tax=Candidatus Aramenus sulfurataquae TaxID=1326980 RepID=A0A0F2LPN0_9CREN|nr:MFS transporter [Candidatus Aramenus sulfurataquae]